MIQKRILNITRYATNADVVWTWISVVITHASLYKSIYNSELSRFMCSVQWEKKHEFKWVCRVVYFDILMLNIPERNEIQKSAGKKIFLPKPVTSEDKNFMTQLFLSIILHSKVYSLSWTFVLNSKWLQGKTF